MTNKTLVPNQKYYWLRTPLGPVLITFLGYDEGSIVIKHGKEKWCLLRDANLVPKDVYESPLWKVMNEVTD